MLAVESVCLCICMMWVVCIYSLTSMNWEVGVCTILGDSQLDSTVLSILDFFMYDSNLGTLLEKLRVVTLQNTDNQLKLSLPQPTTTGYLVMRGSQMWGTIATGSRPPGGWTWRACWATFSRLRNTLFSSSTLVHTTPLAWTPPMSSGRRSLMLLRFAKSQTQFVRRTFYITDCLSCAGEVAVSILWLCLPGFCVRRPWEGCLGSEGVRECRHWTVLCPVIFQELWTL